MMKSLELLDLRSIDLARGFVGVLLNEVGVVFTYCFEKRPRKVK